MTRGQMTDHANQGQEASQKSGNNSRRSYITLPRIISIKSKGFFEIPGVLKELGTGRNGLCICDITTQDIAGNTIRDILEEEDINVAFFNIDEADGKTVDRATKFIESRGFDFVMGVGGGRPIDVAKTSSHRARATFISVPTAPSHDGVASNIASILTDKGRVSINAHPPHAVVTDINVIARAPHRLVASGCGDVISNMTAILDWKLGRDTRDESYSRYASAISQMSYNILRNNIRLVKTGSVAGSHLVMDALVASGMAMSIYGSSRPASGGEHLITHALNRISGTQALHGELCGVSTIFTMYLHEGDWKMVKKLLTSCGAPVTLDHLGVTEDEFIRAVEEAPALRPKRFTILHQQLRQERIRKIVREIGI